MPPELRKIEEENSLPLFFLDRISAAPKKLTKRSSIIIFVPVCAIELCRVVTNGEGRKGNRRRSRVYILVEEKERERELYRGLMYDGDKEESVAGF